MFSSPSGAKGNHSPQKVGDNNIPFENLAKAAQQGNVESVITAIAALETTAPASFESYHLIQYIAHLQDSNKIVISTLCWLALLAKSIAAAKKILSELTPHSFDSLQQQLADYQKSLAKYPTEIKELEDKIAKLNTDNAQEIQHLRARLEPIEASIFAANIDQGQHEAVVELEARYKRWYQNWEKKARPASELHKYITGIYADVINCVQVVTGNTLSSGSRKEAVNAGNDPNELENILRKIRLHLDSLKPHFDQKILEQVAEMKLILEGVDGDKNNRGLIKLEAQEERLWLERLYQHQERVRIEITKTEQILQRLTVVTQFKTAIRNSGSVDDDLIQNYLSTISTAAPLLADISVQLDALTNGKFKELRLGVINKFPPIVMPQTLSSTDQETLHNAMRLFLSEQNVQLLMQQPLNVDYVSQIKQTYDDYILALKQDETIPIELKKSWRNVKTSTEYLKKCSAENNLQAFLFSNSSPQYDSLPLIKDLMWDATENYSENTTVLQQAEQAGCIIAKIYLAEREQQLSFEKLSAKGQTLQTENPAEAFSCFLAALESNEAAAYRLAEILEAQSTPCPVLSKRDETQKYFVAQAILATRKRNSVVANHLWQQALSKGSNYAAAFLQSQPSSDLAVQSTLYAQQNNIAAALACWWTAACANDETATELWLQHQNLSLRQLMLLGNQLFARSAVNSARICFKTALGYGSDEAATILRNQYHWDLEEFKTQQEYFKLQNNEYSLLGQYACYRTRSNSFGDQECTQLKEAAQKGLREKIQAIALSENFRESFIWFENYVADDSLCGRPVVIEKLEHDFHTLGRAPSESFKITDAKEKTFVRFYWLKKLLGQLQHDLRAQHQKDFNIIASYLEKYLDWTDEDFFSHGKIFEEKGYTDVAALFHEKARLLGSALARSTTYFDLVNNSEAGFKNYTQTTGSPEIKPLLTAAIDRGYTDAMFVLKEQYSLRGADLVTLAKGKKTANPIAAALYLLAAANERSLVSGSDTFSISSATTISSVRTTRTFTEKAAADVKKDLVELFKLYYEQWNIINVLKKDHIVALEDRIVALEAPILAVIDILSQYNHGDNSSLIHTIDELKNLAEEGSVTAALYWALLAKVLKGSTQIDLCEQGLRFYQNGNLNAASACWVAALSQENITAAEYLASLLNQHYTHCWFDLPLQAQYRTEFLAQSLIQYFCHKNIEKATQDCLIAIENNSFAAAFLWILLKQCPPDQLVRLGLHYERQNLIAATVTCYSVASKLGDNSAKQLLETIFKTFDSENPFLEKREPSCSKLTLSALDVKDIADKNKQLETAVQKGSAAAAFYLAKSTRQSPNDVVKQGLTLYAANLNYAGAGACWLTAIEQGDTDSAHYLTQQMASTMSQKLEDSVAISQKIAIDKGSVCQQQQRLLAAAAYFSSALKWGSPIAAYHLGNLLRHLQNEWQTATAHGNHLQAAKLSALYTYITTIQSSNSLQHYPTDIRSANQPINFLYEIAQECRENNDDMFSNLADFFAAEKNPAGLQNCTAKILDSAKRFDLAQRYQREHTSWAPRANTLALKHFKKLAAANYLPAIFKMIQVYMLGELGMPLNYKLASEYIKQINSLNDPDAWYQLGMALDTGRYGLPYSPKLAENYYKMAAAQHPNAAAELFARDLNKVANPVTGLDTEAIDRLKKTTRNPHTYYILAQQYEQGANDFAKNEILALNYYLLAALVFNPPHPGACARLETIYREGLLGEGKNEEQANRYARKKNEGLKNSRYATDLNTAMASGNAEAAYRLGNIEKAAELGHPLALKKLIARNDAQKTQYEQKLKALLSPDALYILGYLSSTAKGANATNAALTDSYYHCAAQLGQKNALSQIDPTKKSRLTADDKTAQLKFNLHPQNLLKLGHVYEYVLKDYVTALMCYKKILETTIATAAKNWGPINTEGSPLYTDANHSNELNAIYGATANRLARAYEFGELKLPKDLPSAKTYYVQAASFNDIDALLRFALASACGGLGHPPEPQSTIHNYRLAFSQFSKTRYRSNDAYFLLGLALTQDFFNVYQEEEIVAFLELTLKETNMDFEDLKTALVQQRAHAARAGGGFNDSVAIPVEEQTHSDDPYSFYSTEQNKKIAAILFKVAAEMNHIDAILKLDEFNNTRYFPSHLQTPDDFFDYYQKFDPEYAPVQLRLGRIFDPSLRLVSNRAELNTDTTDSLFGAHVTLEARRYYEWIISLGLNLKPIKFWSAQATVAKLNYTTAIEHYTKAIAADPNCLEALALLAACLLFGENPIQGKAYYQNMITRYKQGAALNILQTHFGFISKNNANTNYHESPLAAREGWKNIYDRSQELIGNPIGNLSSEDLFTLAQYHTVAPTAQEAEQAKFALKPSSLPRTRSIILSNKPTPSSASSLSARIVAANTASPLTPDSVQGRTTAVLTLDPLPATPWSAQKQMRSVSRMSVTDYSPDERSSGTATPTSMASTLSILRRPVAGSSSRQRRRSLSSTHSVTTPVSQDPWQKLLNDLINHQRTNPAESIIDYFQQQEDVEAMSLESTSCFPAWEEPPPNAEANAFRYYRLAADKEYLPALIMLVKINLFGLMKQNINMEAARALYLQARTLTTIELSSPESTMSIQASEISNNQIYISHLEQIASQNVDAMFLLARIHAHGMLNQPVDKNRAIQLYRQALHISQLTKPQIGLHLFLCALAWSEGLLGCSENQTTAIVCCESAKDQSCIEIMPTYLQIAALDLLPKTRDLISIMKQPATPGRKITTLSTYEEALFHGEHFLSYCALGEQYKPKAHSDPRLNIKSSQYVYIIHYLCCIGEAALPKQEKTRLELLKEKHRPRVLAANIGTFDLWQNRMFTDDVITTYINALETNELSPIPLVLQATVNQLLEFIKNPGRPSARTNVLRTKLSTTIMHKLQQIEYVRPAAYFFGIF